MAPAVVVVYVFLAWATDPRTAAVAAWVTLIGGVLIAALVPASERLVTRVAEVAGQPVSGLFASMYTLTVGLGYLVGGIVLDEGGAVVGGAIICTAALLPLVIGRFHQLSAPGLWLLYAVVLTAAAVVFLAALGAGLLLAAPAGAAWMAYREHRARFES